MIPKSQKLFTNSVFEVTTLFEDAASAVLKFENMMINLLQISSASELIQPAGVALQGSGSQFMFSIFVTDVDQALAELKFKGVVMLNGPINRVWGMRTICFADPDGHAWEIAQELR